MTGARKQRSVFLPLPARRERAVVICRLKVRSNTRGHNAANTPTAHRVARLPISINLSVNLSLNLNINRSISINSARTSRSPACRRPRWKPAATAPH